MRLSNKVKCPDCDSYTLERLRLRPFDPRRTDYDACYEESKARYACIGCGEEFVEVENKGLLKAFFGPSRLVLLESELD